MGRSADEFRRRGTSRTRLAGREPAADPVRAAPPAVVGDSRTRILADDPRPRTVRARWMVDDPFIHSPEAQIAPPPFPRAMPAEAASRPIRAGSRLERILASGGFAVTAEIAPPASADASEIRRHAAAYRGTVDACNVTDGQRALVRISSLAGALIALQVGVEPIMQMVSRDRNRIGLQSDLLGASALGIHNVLCLWGDPPAAGNEKDAKAVFDLNTEEMIATFRALRDTGILRGGDKVENAPKVFIGAAADPFRGSNEESFGKLRGKVMAGADFVQTQGVYDVDAFEEWMRLVRKEWLHDKVYILAGVIPLKSAKMARFMVEKLGAVVPKHIVNRMERAPNPKAEGVSIAVRTIKALEKIEGVRGVHLMPIGWEEVVPDLVQEAGLLPRPDPTPRVTSPSA